MSSTAKPDGRHYLIDGQRYVRVTTVLGVIAKPGLLVWYGKHGTEACRRLMREAQDFGTRFHAALELHARGLLLPWDIEADLAPHVDAARRWFDANVLEVVGIEQRVHSPTHGYAGTADLLARVRGVADERPVALDWKTSKEVGFEHGFQLSAYLEAAGECDVRLFGRVVLHAPRERPGLFAAHVLPADEHRLDFAAFLDALRLFRRVDELERRRRAAWRRQRAVQAAKPA